MRRYLGTLMLQPGPLELTELVVLNELQRLVFKNPSVTDASRREHQRSKKQSLSVCKPTPQIFHSFGWWSDGWRVNSSHSRTVLLTSLWFMLQFILCAVSAQIVPERLLQNTDSGYVESASLWGSDVTLLPTHRRFVSELGAHTKGLGWFYLAWIN